MKRIVLLTLCAALAVSCLSGCVVVNFGDWGANTVTGKGDLERYEITVGDYSKIRIEGQCDVHYYAASSDTVTLTVQQNLREYFEVEVIGNELVVRSDRGVNIKTTGNNTPVLTVSAPVLSHLSLKGMGSFITYDTIVADSLTITQSGMGDSKAALEVGELTLGKSGMGGLILSGTADKADFDVSGMGSLDAFALQTRAATLKFNGMGSAYLYCTDTISIEASGMGSVEYKGSPSVEKLSTSGMVSVKQMD